MHGDSATVTVLLVVMAIGVGVVLLTGLAHRIKFSAPLLIVAVAVGVSLIPGVPELHADPELVLFVLLPPLLYAAARGNSYISIKNSRRAIGMLAVGMVVVTALAVGVVTHIVVPDVSWAAAIALGAVVGPPDAVAATAVARRAGLPRRIVTILEGESLFNDATALVTLRVSIAAAVEGAFSLGDTVLAFLVAAVGGLAFGTICGLLVSWVRSRMTSPLLTTALSLLIPYAVYVAAEQARLSGVIAVVVTGLVLAHRSPTDYSPAARLTEESVWSTTQLLLEGAVFALVGLQLAGIVAGVEDPLLTVVLLSAAVLVVVLLVRPLWVFGLVYVARILPWTSKDRPSAGSLAVISWAGMRGVVSLAAAQTLPLDLPQRNLFLLATMVVIFGTLGLQGMTLPALIRRVGVEPPDPRQDAFQVAGAQQRATDAAKRRIEEIQHEEGLSDRLVAILHKQLDLRTYTAWEQLGDQHDETPMQVYQRLRREIVTAERGVFVELRDAGELEEDLLRELQHRLDLEESLLPDPIQSTAEGHQEVIPSGLTRLCEDLRQAPTVIPDADPRECAACVEEGRYDWVHLRVCLACDHVGCCDSSPGRHSVTHFHQTGHPVMGSAEAGEHWRWCFVHERVG